MAVPSARRASGLKRNHDAHNANVESKAKRKAARAQRVAARKAGQPKPEAGA
ncbi:MAG: hypothetical protein NVV60_01600 [Luteimonas sp.]|nr:hypothetical protein [Luteimonas sp.]